MDSQVVKLLADNTEAIVAVAAIVADVALTRCPKTAWKGVILRLISTIGKAAQRQVDNGTKKGQNGNVTFSVLPLLLAISIFASCAVTKNVGDGKIDILEEACVRSIAGTVFLAHPAYAGAILSVADTLANDFVNSGTPVRLGALSDMLSERLLVLGVAPSVQQLVLNFSNIFVAYAIETVGIDKGTTYRPAVVLRDALLIIKSEAGRALSE